MKPFTIHFDTNNINNGRIDIAFNQSIQQAEVLLKGFEGQLQDEAAKSNIRVLLDHSIFANVVSVHADFGHHLANGNFQQMKGYIQGVVIAQIG